MTTDDPFLAAGPFELTIQLDTMTDVGWMRWAEGVTPYTMGEECGPIAVMALNAVRAALRARAGLHD